MADLVAMQLERENYHVTVRYDGGGGLETLRRDKPELVLLDIMLPGISGTDILRQIRSDPAVAEVAVIMLTARGTESDIVVGLHLGADDYVTKPFSMSVLSARIAAVLRRRRQAGPDGGVITAGPVRINRQTHTVEVEGETLTLTLTEFRLLAALAGASGRVLTRDQLIDRAIGSDAVVTDRTIDVHLAALRKKLGAARSYIRTVRGVGYRFSQDEQ